jgi:hypothetical protein
MQFPSDGGDGGRAQPEFPGRDDVVAPVADDGQHQLLAGCQKSEVTSDRIHLLHMLEDGLAPVPPAAGDGAESIGEIFGGLSDGIENAFYIQGAETGKDAELPPGRDYEHMICQRCGIAGFRQQLDYVAFEGCTDAGDKQIGRFGA